MSTHLFSSIQACMNCLNGEEGEELVGVRFHLLKIYDISQSAKPS